MTDLFELVRPLARHLWLLFTLRHDGRGLLTTYGGGMLVLLAIAGFLTAVMVDPLNALLLVALILAWRVVGVDAQVSCALLLFRSAALLLVEFGLPFEQSLHGLLFYSIYELLFVLTLLYRRVKLRSEQTLFIQSPTPKED